MTNEELTTKVQHAFNEIKKGNFYSAIELAQKALILASECNLQDINPKAWNVIGSAYNSLGSYDKALKYFAKALAAYEELGDTSGIAEVTGNIGTVHHYLGSLDKALHCFSEALAIHEKLGEKSKIAQFLGDIGAVHLNLGSYDIALEHFIRALDLHEELNELSGIATVTGNIGGVHGTLGDYNTALEYFTKALAIHEELNDKPGIARFTGNIGIMHSSLKDYDQALHFQKKALGIAKEIGNKRQMGYWWKYIGNTLSAMGNHAEAMEYLLRSLHLRQEELQTNEGVAETLFDMGVLLADQNRVEEAMEKLDQGLALAAEQGEKAIVCDAHLVLYTIHKSQGDISSALSHHEKYHESEKEIINEETARKATMIENRRKIEEAERDRQVKLARFQEQEKILLNILPAKIAERMISGEKSIVESYESVSVLFADIVGFTKLSQRTTPEELVAGLDNIFHTFDLLSEKHGCEKIKTIGDCYMVVAGLPKRCDDHVERSARLALDMLKAIAEFPAIVEDVVINMRIGIHCGEVVAGVIGRNKFAYDLWGDSVNTASRMESHGEAGKIHVSEEFVRAVEARAADVGAEKSLPLHFTPRGEMDIKGKGLMKTYFLEKA